MCFGGENIKVNFNTFNFWTGLHTDLLNTGHAVAPGVGWRQVAAHLGGSISRLCN
jgi:hypothetical protein